MKCRASPCRWHRFPPEIIQYAVWLCYRLDPSHRDIEDILAQRGIVVTHGSILLWCNIVLEIFGDDGDAENGAIGRDGESSIQSVLVKLQAALGYLVASENAEAGDLTSLKNLVVLLIQQVKN